VIILYRHTDASGRTTIKINAENLRVSGYFGGSFVSFIGSACK
jgi:hypothetical protein